MAPVPDDLDYAWLASLMSQPEKWSADDFATAEFLLTEQTRALEETPRDVRSRRSMQEVVDGLEAAIAAYRDRDS